MRTCPYCGDGPEAVGTLNHIECVEKLQAEIKRLRGLLSMVCGSFDDWEEPEPDAKDRQWSSRFQTYLRGCVIAQSTFTVEEWSQVRAIIDEARRTLKLPSTRGGDSQLRRDAKRELGR